MTGQDNLLMHHEEFASLFSERTFYHPVFAMSISCLV